VAIHDPQDNPSEAGPAAGRGLAASRRRIRRRCALHSADAWDAIQASGGRRSAGTTWKASPKSQSSFSSVPLAFDARVAWEASPGGAGRRGGLRRDGRRLGGSAFLVMARVSYCTSGCAATR